MYRYRPRSGPSIEGHGRGERQRTGVRIVMVPLSMPEVPSFAAGSVDTVVKGTADLLGESRSEDDVDRRVGPVDVYA